MDSSSRRELLQLAMTLAVAAVLPGSLAVTTAGCSRSGGGSSSGGGGGGGGGGGNTVSVLAATSGAGASITNSPVNFSFGSLVTGVSRSGQSVRGDLNYNPWQASDAATAQVQRGSTVTWLVNGQGSGGSLSLTA